MKKHLLFLFACATYFSCLAQHDSIKKQLGIIPKADLFLPIGGYSNGEPAFSFSVEKFLGKHTSFQLAYTYFYFGGQPGQNPPPVWQGSTYMSQIFPEFRYYFGKAKRHKGVYLGAYPELVLRREVNVAPVSFFNPVQAGYTYTTQAWGGGMDAGFQTFIFKRIALDFLLGYGIAEIKKVKMISSYNSDFGYDYLLNQVGRYARIAVNVGYKF